MDAIVLKHVHKDFKKRAVRREYTTFKSELVRWVTRQGRVPQSMFLTVLRDINLTVAKGKTFGLIGRNGSGKSTLLKLVTGIYAPTSGSVTVNGRISALLELGAGFHPDFTGRENIYINGIILGMTRKEIRGRMDEIIEFSELGEFVDQPVRTYSSGMFARLAFSVATHVDPDILIIDEILSVGDEHFGHKSSLKLEQFRNEGKTILLVTHDLGTLQKKCDVAAWLDAGVIRASGNPAEVVAEYRQAVADGEARGIVAAGATSISLPSASERAPARGIPAETGKRWGSFEMEFENVRVLGASGKTLDVYRPEDSLTFSLDYFGAKSIPGSWVELSVRREDGTVLWTGATGGPDVSTPMALAAQGTLRLKMLRIGLAEGSYRVDVGCFGPERIVYDFWSGQLGFTVRAATRAAGLIRPEFQWVHEAGATSARASGQ